MGGQSSTRLLCRRSQVQGFPLKAGFKVKDKDDEHFSKVSVQVRNQTKSEELKVEKNGDWLFSVCRKGKASFNGLLIGREELFFSLKGSLHSLDCFFKRQ